MAKLIYDLDGEFTISNVTYRPKVEHMISDALAAEIQSQIEAWRAKGFRLLEYAPPAPIEP